MCGRNEGGRAGVKPAEVEVRAGQREGNGARSVVGRADGPHLRDDGVSGNRNEGAAANPQCARLRGEDRDRDSSR